MSEKQTEQVVATVSEALQAEGLRKTLMDSENHLWVLVYRKPDEFDVAVQNVWGNRVTQVVLERCIKVANGYIEKNPDGATSHLEEVTPDTSEVEVIEVQDSDLLDL